MVGASDNSLGGVKRERCESPDALGLHPRLRPLDAARRPLMLLLDAAAAAAAAAAAVALLARK